MPTKTIAGFEVDLDRAYELKTHMWVQVISADCVRIGMDSLGLETSGTLAQLQFHNPGSVLLAGTAIGSLEAEKFVGPLITPVAGEITKVNSAAMQKPSVTEQDPYEQGWMIELRPSDLDNDLRKLTQGTEQIEVEFKAKVAEYKRDGVLAE